MAGPADTRPAIGWLRAILTSAVVVVLGLGLVYGTNDVLTKAHRLTRSGTVAISTSMFFVVLIGLAWLLRKLQQRHIL